jgi:anti-sigma factor RsiW
MNRAHVRHLRHTGAMGVLREFRDRIRHRRDPYRCQEAVELVTDYLEGAMSPVEVERFERHLHRCADCVRYVEQVQRTVDALGQLHPPPPAGATQVALLDAFRNFHRD